MIDTKPPTPPDRILISKMLVDELVQLPEALLTGGSTWGLLGARHKFLTRRAKTDLSLREATTLGVIEKQLALRGVLHASDITT